MIPLELSETAGTGPEIGGDVYFEGVGCGVVEGRDYEGLVDVFGDVGEDFPSSLWENVCKQEIWLREGVCLPSYSIPAQEGACHMSSNCQYNEPSCRFGKPLPRL